MGSVTFVTFCAFTANGSTKTRRRSGFICERLSIKDKGTGFPGLLNILLNYVHGVGGGNRRDNNLLGDHLNFNLSTKSLKYGGLQISRTDSSGINLTISSRMLSKETASIFLFSNSTN